MTLWNLSLQVLATCPFMAQTNDGEGNGDGHHCGTAPEMRSNRRHKLGWTWSKSRILPCLPHPQTNAVQLNLCSVET